MLLCRLRAIRCNGILNSMEITKEGLEKLKAELNGLKTVKRKELTERLQKAIAFGDLSENFDYHNAKEEQEMLERRIAEIEDIISGSSIVVSRKGGDTVRIGSRVVLQTGNEKMDFLITGSQEANPIEQKLSAESPLGQALLGKKKGDAFEAQTPGGAVEYKVLDIS